MASQVAEVSAGPDGRGGGGTGKDHREWVLTVNEQSVTLHGTKATGADIKTAALTQGAQIQLNFVLQEELPNGTSKIIGDDDVIHLREHLRFTAIAPDDNS